MKASRFPPTLWQLEEVRHELRDLIKFIEREKQKPVYTNFEDQIGPGEEITLLFATQFDMENYHEKMEKYIRDNQNHMTIYKLRQNYPITAMDLSELERLLFVDTPFSDRQVFVQVYGSEQPLGQFIRSVVGLNPEAVKAAFSQFIANPAFNADQITFIQLILNYLTRNGYMEKEKLMGQPFTDLHTRGLHGMFNSQEANTIIYIIDTINNNALCQEAVG